MKLFFLLTLFSFPALALDSAEYVARIEQMVAAGAITKEAAQSEKLQLARPQGQGAIQRGLAQRGLASVTPELKPLKIRRFKAKTMELLLD